ncbi:MAG: KTSC domain-containing protein, partial [Mesorhizobium sp.]
MNRIVTSSEALSDRERAVAERFAAGMTYREIGQVLFIAPSTVRTHLAAIYEKLGVSNKVALARRISTVADTAPTTALPSRILSVWFVASGKRYDFEGVPPETYAAFR